MNKECTNIGKIKYIINTDKKECCQSVKKERGKITLEDVLN